MAAAVEDLFPRWEVLSCGCSDLGFYVELLPEQELTELPLTIIEERMHSLKREGALLRKAEMLAGNGVDFFRHHKQLGQAERAAEWSQQLLPLVFVGERAWILEGEVVEDLASLGAFALTDHTALGEGETLVLHGMVAENKQLLKKQLKRWQQAQKIDHCLLGKQQELFDHLDFSGPGGFSWLPKGERLRRRLRDAWESHVEEAGFQLVCTPHADGRATSTLHAALYRERERRYADLPLAFAELRWQEEEADPLQLCGLLRAREASRDVASLYCRTEQLRPELARSLQSIQDWLTIFDIDSRIQLSLRPGTSKRWQEAEAVLKETVHGLEICECEAGPHESGPALTFVFEDAAGRSWPVSKLGFNLRTASELELRYLDAGEQSGKPWLIEVSWLHSLERWIALLLERKEGWLPPRWAPEQLRILPTRSACWPAAEELLEKLGAVGLRATIDRSGDKLAARVREALLAQVPYYVVIGPQELEKNQVQLRDCRRAVDKTVPREDVLAWLERECV